MTLRRPILAVLLVLAMLISACGAGTPRDSATTTSATAAPGTVLTVYSASGLGAWYTSQFGRFTADTGIKVNVVEGGSGELVARTDSERSDPKADLIVVLPPFIQKAAKSGLLQPSEVDTTGITSQLVGPAAIYVPIVDNALSFIANPAASPQPTSWNDLLSPEFKGKLQYSLPARPATAPRSCCCCST